MRKMLFAIFAMGALISCSNDEILDLNREQIAFGDVFVDNGTRADYSQLGKPVEAFKVWGTATGTGTLAGNTVQIFNGADVEKPDNYYNQSTGYASTAWLCDVTQYWLPKVKYKFAAIVDGEFAKNGTVYDYTKIPFAVADGEDNLDLLYAEAEAETDENGAPNVELVAFTFNHLLSKMQFKIVNETNVDYQVTEIKVTGFAQKGIYAKGANGTWAWTKDGDTKTPLTFGTAIVLGKQSVVASGTRQILPLPVPQTLDVTITYVKVDEPGKIFTKNGTISDYTFKMNTVYEVIATISGTAIDFDFDINTNIGWGESDINIQ